MQKSGDQNSQALDLGNQLQSLDKREISQNLPKNVCLKLYDLMNLITTKEITPDSINSACNCASQIHKIVKLNYEMSRK